MIRTRLQKLWRNNLVKSVLVVASGTAGAQAIGIIFIPIITRIYGPEAYGVLGVFIALTTVLTVLSSLAYPVAIVLPRFDNIAKNLIKISIIIASFTSLIVFLFLWFAGTWILSLLGVENLIDFMYFIPLVMLITAFQEVSLQWLIRKKAFRETASISIMHSLINYGSQAFIGLYTPFISILITVHSTSLALRALLAEYFGRKFKSNDKIIENETLMETLIKYKDFPLYRSPQMILYAVSQTIPVLMLTGLFGAIVAGHYTLTRTVLNVPVTLLGGSVQSVLYPSLNESFNTNEKTKPIIFKATLSLAALGLVPFAIVALWGPFLFGLIFGKEWTVAGNYAQWISFWMFFYLIERPAVSAIPIFKLQRWFLFFEVFSLISKFLLIFISFYFFRSEVKVIALYSLFNIFLSTVLIFKIFSVAARIDKKLEF